MRFNKFGHIKNINSIFITIVTFLVTKLQLLNKKLSDYNYKSMHIIVVYYNYKTFQKIKNQFKARTNSNDVSVFIEIISQ